MSEIIQDRKQLLTNLLDGTFSTLSTIVGMQHEVKKSRILEQSLHLTFGVLVGMTIDLKGKFILAGDTRLFSSIGESMFGIRLKGVMLLSFIGELANMLAAGLSTYLVKFGIHTDITTPTILQEDVISFENQNAFQLNVIFENRDEMNIYLIVD